MSWGRLVRGLAAAATIAVPAACGQSSVETASESLSAQPAAATVAPLEASSEEFQRAGEEIAREKAAHPELLSQFVPFITDPVDIGEPGEYRIPVSLPPGTDTHSLGIVAPGDFLQKLVLGEMKWSPEGVVKDGNATIVLTIIRVVESYEGFQLWIQ